MIEIKGLTRRFGAVVTAVDGLTLTIAEGEVFGLLGPNGAGKTELGKTFLRLGTPSSRRVAEGPPVVARCEALSRCELRAEHGCAAVADPFRDLLDGQARGFE